MVCFVTFLHCFVNEAIVHELCNQMGFDFNCANLHHCVILEGL